MRVGDSASRSAEQDLALEVYDPPRLQAPSPGPARLGQPFTLTLATAGGKPPLTFSSTGSLPPGLSLSEGGTLLGTPQAAGTFNFTAAVAEEVRTRLASSPAGGLA